MKRLLSAASLAASLVASLAAPLAADELPETGMVALLCNTGPLSAQATFAARLMGRENVLVLQTGLIGWKKRGAYKPDA